MTPAGLRRRLPDGRALSRGVVVALVGALGIAAQQPAHAVAAKPFGAFPSCSKNGKKSTRFCFAAWLKW
jgi:hypothetical protein